MIVLLAHLWGTRHFPMQGAGRGAMELGALGVKVFFVISGFLITGLLMGEARETGGINLGRFYFRRTLRIFPAYYLYVTVIAIVTLAGAIKLFPGDIEHALTYTMNYHRPRAWYSTPGHSPWRSNSTCCGPRCIAGWEKLGRGRC
jgi:peptidoglycan/LPS O-acetylase OafA/YrhL